MDNRLKIYQNRDNSYDAIRGNKLLHYNWSFETLKISNIKLIPIGPNYVPVGRLIHKPHRLMIFQVQRSFWDSNESIMNFDEFINEGIRDKMTPKSDEDVKRMLNNMSIDDICLMCLKQREKITDYLSIDDIKKKLHNLPINKVIDICKEQGLKLTDFASIEDIQKSIDKKGLKNQLKMSCEVGTLDMVKQKVEQSKSSKLELYPTDRYNIVKAAINSGNMQIVDYLIDNGFKLNRDYINQLTDESEINIDNLCTAFQLFIDKNLDMSKAIDMISIYCNYPKYDKLVILICDNFPKSKKLIEKEIQDRSSKIERLKKFL